MKRSLVDADININNNDNLDLESRRKKIRCTAPFIKSTGIFYIKTLRSDNKCYFLKFAKELADPKNNKFSKRRGLKKIFTLTGSHPNLFSRTKIEGCILKPSQYTEAQKENFTNFQSTSIGTDKLFPRAFDFGQREILVGVLIEEKNVLPSNRLLKYNGRTLVRPYDFFTKNECAAYQNQIKLYGSDQLDKFLADLKFFNGYSEPLVRLKWVCDGTCKIFIATDNLAARLLARQYADTLLAELKKAGRCLAAYQIPICFYTVGQDDLLYKEYTDDEYRLDLEEALMIFNDMEARIKHYKAAQYEFLLGLAPKYIPQVLVETVDDMPFAIYLLQTGHIHIYQFLLEKINNNFNIEQLLSQISSRADYQAILFKILKNAIRHRDVMLITQVLERINTQAVKNSSLIAFAIEEDLFTVAEKLILSGHFNLDAVDDYGLMPLTLAAEKKQPAIINLLLKMGANFDAPNKEGHTPLMKLIRHGRTDACRLLISCCQPKLDTTTNDDKNPLLYAVANGLIDIVVLLLEQNVTITNSMIEAAINNGHAEILHLLGKYNPEAIKTITIDQIHIGGFTKNIKVLEALLEYNVKIRNVSCFNAALSQVQTVIAGLLLKQNPLLIEEKKGVNTPLINALLNNTNIKSIKFLLANKANTEAKDIDGNTALILAVKAGDVELVNLLLKNKANVNAKNISGKSALILAAKKGHASIVDSLLKNNAIIDQKDYAEIIQSISIDAEVRNLISRNYNFNTRVAKKI